MEELLACRVCLATDSAKLYSFFKFQLAQAYEILTGSQVLVSDGLPQHICSFCSALLLKSVTFKEKCINSQDLLKYCLNEQSELSMGYLRSIKREIHTLILPYSVTNYEPVNVSHDGQVSVKAEETYKENDQLNDIPTITAFDIKFEDDTSDTQKKRKKKKRGKEKKDHLNIVTIKCEDNQEIDDLTNNQYEELDNEFNEFNDESEIDEINDEVIINTDLKDVEIVNLTRQEQLDEIEARKMSFNYINSAYKCDKCYKGFITDSTYKNHMQRHDPKNGAYECEICFSRWPESRSLRAHVVNSHKRKFICKLCDFVSRSSHRAKEHCKWHQGFTFICKICGASFAKSTSHLTHIRLQHPSNHSCDICGESFIGEFGLRIHKKRAHKDLDVTQELSLCNHCNTEFYNLDAFKRHLECSTTGLCDPDIRACGQCGEGFQSEDQLLEHSKEHRTTPEDRVHCDDCKRSFTSEKSYSIHYQRVHLGVKLKQRKPCLKRPEDSVVCEICGKRCITKATLRYHQRIHTGERPFQCTECPKKFSVFQRLQIHLRTHTGEAPYKCKHCPKAFKHKAALNRHDRVHTGAKPYMCSHCGKAFSQSNSMKLHVNTVHLKLPAPYRSRRNKN